LARQCFLRQMRRLNSLIIAGVVTASIAGTPAIAAWIDGDVAQLQALDKITARISTLTAPIGQATVFGTLSITVKRCAYRPPEEPPEDAGFIDIIDRGHDGQSEGKGIFSGWMFSSSPAVSALEHPVYDITLLACASD